MIFGFGKKSHDDEIDDEIELVLLQGALNGKEANLAANARLAEAGLIPAKELISDALMRRADTMRIEPKGERTAVNLLIDGVPYPGGRLSKQQGMAITQIIKLLAGLDPKERKAAQSGGIKAEFDDTPYTLYVDSTPLPSGGERLTVRAQNLSLNLDTAEDLGFPDELKSKIREMTAGRNGFILVTGPPRSGTTTTSFAVLRSVDAYLYVIFTIADTGGRNLNNVTPFKGNEGDSLSETMTRVKRVEADVVFLDPIANDETAKVILEHQKEVAIIAEMPAKDPFAAIQQLCKMAGSPKKVASGLSGVVSQKLARRLCTTCREAYRPNPKLLARVGLPADTKVLYRQFKPTPPEDGRRGSAEEIPICDHCGGLGYYGRVAMFELVEMTDEMRKLVAAGASPTEMKALVKKAKMLTLQRDGLRLVAEGVTSLEELQRIFK